MCCGHMDLKDCEGEGRLLGRSFGMSVQREKETPWQQLERLFVMLFAHDDEATEADLCQEQRLMRGDLPVEKYKHVRRIRRFFGREEFGVKNGMGRKEGKRKEGRGGEKEERAILTCDEEKVVLEG